ncbi:MAG: hypothetical protein KBS85_06835 [Lachnospiraceae bacterium]|nr:hypothetical protein [Candidatus Merdinaster equi]
MVKLRIQGTKIELKKFLKVLARNKLLTLENESEFIPNKGTEKYYRYYAEVFFADSKLERR